MEDLHLPTIISQVKFVSFRGSKRRCETTLTPGAAQGILEVDPVILRAGAWGDQDSGKKRVF